MGLRIFFVNQNSEFCTLSVSVSMGLFIYRTDDCCCEVFSFYLSISNTNSLTERHITFSGFGQMSEVSL